MNVYDGESMLKRLALLFYLKRKHFIKYEKQETLQTQINQNCVIIMELIKKKKVNKNT